MAEVHRVLARLEVLLGEAEVDSIQRGQSQLPRWDNVWRAHRTRVSCWSAARGAAIFPRWSCGSFTNANKGMSITRCVLRAQQARLPLGLADSPWVLTSETPLLVILQRPRSAPHPLSSSPNPSASGYGRSPQCDRLDFGIVQLSLEQRDSPGQSLRSIGVQGRPNGAARTGDGSLVRSQTEIPFWQMLTMQNASTESGA